MQDQSTHNQHPHRDDRDHDHHKQSSDHTHNVHASSLVQLTTAATTHCLVGCAIGEWVGLALGVSLRLTPWATMAIATILGFVGGYTFGLWPLVRQEITWGQAFRTIWLGETISIAAMEFAMNFTDYHMGGLQATSLLSVQFWLGYAVAVPVGFIIAWPVNYLLLKRGIKQHHH